MSVSKWAPDVGIDCHRIVDSQFKIDAISTTFEGWINILTDCFEFENLII